MDYKDRVRRLALLLITIFLSVGGLAAGQDADNLQRAIRLFTAERYEDAKALLERSLATHGDDAAVHYFLGRTYFELCKYKKAVQHSKRAVELKDDSADYHFWLGRTYGEKAKHSNPLGQALLARKVRRAFERTVELDTMHVGGRTGLANFYLQAPSVLGGDIGKAYVQAKALTELDELKGRLLLARIYEKEGKLDLAEATYRDLDTRYAGSADVYGLYENYGSFLLKQKRYDEAIERFNKQVKLRPDEVQAHRKLGDAYKAAGRLLEAANEYQRASNIRPKCKSLENTSNRDKITMRQSAA